jgi:hypothetical protein
MKTTGIYYKFLFRELVFFKINSESEVDLTTIFKFLIAAA